MSEETKLFVELMLQAEVFCESVESIVKRQGKPSEDLRLKINQCRGALSQLQELFDEDTLSTDDPLATTTFRNLIMSLMWVTFRAKEQIDFKLFRKLVTIESGFTYLLIRKQKSKR